MPCRGLFHLSTWGRTTTNAQRMNLSNEAKALCGKKGQIRKCLFLAAKGAAQEALICGEVVCVLANVEIHLSPFKCQLFHSFIID